MRSTTSCNATGLRLPESPRYFAMKFLLALPTRLLMASQMRSLALDRGLTATFMI